MGEFTAPHTNKAYLALVLAAFLCLPHVIIERGIESLLNELVHHERA